MQRLATLLALSLTAAMPAAAQDNAQGGGSQIETVIVVDTTGAADADYEANLDASCADGDDFVECDAYIDDTYGAATPQPQDWDVLYIRGTDYSPESYLAKEEGVVGFRIAVDAQGIATGCEVTSSSGIARLDEATCPALMSRVPTFDPATDANGEAVAGYFEDEAGWRIREPELSNFTVKVHYVIDTSGNLESCEILQMEGDLPASATADSVCEGPPMRNGAVYRDENGVPTRKSMIFEFHVQTEDVAD